MGDSEKKSQSQNNPKNRDRNLRDRDRSPKSRDERDRDTSSPRHRDRHFRDPRSSRDREDRDQDRDRNKGGNQPRYRDDKDSDRKRDGERRLTSSRSGNRAREGERDRRRSRNSRSYSRDRKRSRSRSRSRKRRKKSKKEKKKKKKKKRSRSGSSEGVDRRKMMQEMILAQAKAAEEQRKYQAWLQQTKHSRCIYVGGVGHVPQADLFQFWNAVVNKCMGDDNRNAVLSVYVNAMRNFAFVEFDSMQIATCCMDLDGISYNGQPINIRRPKNYNAELARILPNPINTEKDEEVMKKFNPEAVGIETTGLRTVCDEGPNKIYVGNLPPHLPNAHIQELLEAVGGKLKALQVVRNVNTGLSKGYGFCEFEDHSKTEQAIKDLSGLDVGNGKLLIVKRALVGNESLVYSPTTPTGVSVGSSNAAPISPVAAEIREISNDVPTRILVLTNMITDEELRNPVEYNEIKRDIQSECSNYGKVLSFRLPRMNQTKNQDHVAKVFVEYKTVEEAKKARKNIEGRSFAQRTIGCRYMSEREFSVLADESLND